MYILDCSPKYNFFSFFFLFLDLNVISRTCFASSPNDVFTELSHLLHFILGEGDINAVLIKTLAEAHANTNLKLDIVHEMFRKPQVRFTFFVNEIMYEQKKYTDFFLQLNLWNLQT